MKIVVLDGFTLNPGDLNWEGLKQIGELIVNDRTPYNSDEIIKAIGDAEIVLTNKTPLSKEVLEKTSSVKYIGVLATGYNVVDTESAKELGIVVTNIPEYSTTAVAQFTLGLILEMCHHIGNHNTDVKEGRWTNSIDFCFWNSPLIELEGKTLGIIGFGKIGRATAKIAQAFGLKILAYSRTQNLAFENDSCKYTSLDNLLAQSDIISLHCPLSENTTGLISSENIKKMKDGVMLVNTSRGPLVNEQDLADALNSGKISQAAIDVVSFEPIKAENPLLTAKNCIITPHIAWAPKESRSRLMNTTVENLQAFLNKKPQNVVNS